MLPLGKKMFYMARSDFYKPQKYLFIVVNKIYNLMMMQIILQIQWLE